MNRYAYFARLWSNLDENLYKRSVQHLGSVKIGLGKGVHFYGRAVKSSDIFTMMIAFVKCVPYLHDSSVRRNSFSEHSVADV